MPGLIEQVLQLGLERKELLKDHPKAMIGGANIPYPPKDMASLVTILKGRTVKSYLALEAQTDGAVKFLEAHLQIPRVIRAETTEKALRKSLRSMAEPVDLISIDGRGLPIDPATALRYIQGGRNDNPREFGVGTPTDYGISKIRPGGSIIVNLADPAALEVWHQIRSRYARSYQSPFVGMVYVPAH